MNTLRKGLVIAIATLGLGTIAAAAPDQAAQAPGTSWHSGASGQHGQKFAERMAKRQAALHDKLALTPAQEGAWQAFTARMQATVSTRSDAGPAKTLTAPERAGARRTEGGIPAGRTATGSQPCAADQGVLCRSLTRTAKDLRQPVSGPSSSFRPSLSIDRGRNSSLSIGNAQAIDRRDREQKQ